MPLQPNASADFLVYFGVKRYMKVLMSQASEQAMFKNYFISLRFSIGKVFKYITKFTMKQMLLK
jgi:hypothetical protein